MGHNRMQNTFIKRVTRVMLCYTSINHVMFGFKFLTHRIWVELLSCHVITYYNPKTTHNMNYQPYFCIYFRLNFQHV